MDKVAETLWFDDYQTYQSVRRCIITMHRLFELEGHIEGQRCAEWAIEQIDKLCAERAKVFQQLTDKE